MKPIILAIVGPSGSGKTSLAEMLKQKLNIPVIVSYTTRPMRIGETDGVEHYFVAESKIPSRDKMLAYTKFGGFHYWSLHNQIPLSGPCSYVIDEKGLIKLMEEYDNTYNIIPILIKRDMNKLKQEVDLDRLKRDKHRITIEDAGYTAIIDNNSTLEEFYKIALSTIKKLL